MLKTKVKAFLKYKEYRKYLLEKLSKKIKSKNFSFLIHRKENNNISLKEVSKKRFFGRRIFSNIQRALAVMTAIAITFGIYGINKNMGETIYADSNFDLKKFFSSNKLFDVVNLNKNIDMQNVKKVEENKPKQEDNKQAINTQDGALKTEYEDIVNKYNELINENEKLKDDNISLQNSVRLAASSGAKPQNYRESNPSISRSGTLRCKYVGQFQITSYTPTKEECGSSRGITASGNPIIAGVSVAVDTKYWPLGTVFYIKGLGYVIAMDTGSAIKGKNRIDYAVFNKEFAKKIGRRSFEVYLIKMGNGKIENYDF